MNLNSALRELKRRGTAHGVFTAKQKLSGG